jgi:hypothetical protein
MVSDPGLDGRPSESDGLLGGIASDAAAGCAMWARKWSWGVGREAP